GSQGSPARPLLREPRTDARAEIAIESTERRVELLHRIGEQRELALEAARVDPERELHRPPRLAEAAPPTACPPRVVVGMHVDLSGGRGARRLFDDIDAPLARAELLQRRDRERVRLDDALRDRLPAGALLVSPERRDIERVLLEHASGGEVRVAHVEV